MTGEKQQEIDLLKEENEKLKKPFSMSSDFMSGIQASVTRAFDQNSMKDPTINLPALHAHTLTILKEG